MLDGSFTVSDWRYYHGNSKKEWPFTLNAYPNVTIYDQNNYDYYEGGVVAPQSGGSGISAVWVNARWMAKLAGLYQFPYGISVSFAFNARDGYVIPKYVTVNARNIGNIYVYGTGAGTVGKFGDTRLPAFAELNLRRREGVQRHRETPVQHRSRLLQRFQLGYGPGTSRQLDLRMVESSPPHSEPPGFPGRRPGGVLIPGPYC